jgi:prophage regulatory protein
MNNKPVILRLPDVKERVGLGRSSIYNRIAENTFPSSISLGGNAVGWLEHEIDSWLEDCINRSRPTNK